MRYDGIFRFFFHNMAPDPALAALIKYWILRRIAGADGTLSHNGFFRGHRVVARTDNSIKKLRTHTVNIYGRQEEEEEEEIEGNWCFVTIPSDEYSFHGWGPPFTDPEGEPILSGIGSQYELGEVYTPGGVPAGNSIGYVKFGENERNFEVRRGHSMLPWLHENWFDKENQIFLSWAGSPNGALVDGRLRWEQNTSQGDLYNTPVGGIAVNWFDLYADRTPAGFVLHYICPDFPPYCEFVSGRAFFQHYFQFNDQLYQPDQAEEYDYTGGVGFGLQAAYQWLFIRGMCSGVTEDGERWIIIVHCYHNGQMDQVIAYKVSDLPDLTLSGEASSSAWKYIELQGTPYTILETIIYTGEGAIPDDFKTGRKPWRFNLSGTRGLAVSWGYLPTPSGPNEAATQGWGLYEMTVDWSGSTPTCSTSRRESAAGHESAATISETHNAFLSEARTSGCNDPNPDLWQCPASGAGGSYVVLSDVGNVDGTINSYEILDYSYNDDEELILKRNDDISYHLEWAFARSGIDTIPGPEETVCEGSVATFTRTPISETSVGSRTWNTVLSINGTAIKSKVSSSAINQDGSQPWLGFDAPISEVNSSISATWIGTKTQNDVIPIFSDLKHRILVYISREYSENRNMQWSKHDPDDKWNANYNYSYSSVCYAEGYGDHQFTRELGRTTTTGGFTDTDEDPLTIDAHYSVACPRFVQPFGDRLDDPISDLDVEYGQHEYTIQPVYFSAYQQVDCPTIVTIENFVPLDIGQPNESRQGNESLYWDGQAYGFQAPTHDIEEIWCAVSPDGDFFLSGSDAFLVHHCGTDPQEWYGNEQFVNYLRLIDRGEIDTRSELMNDEETVLASLRFMPICIGWFSNRYARVS